MGNLVRFSVAMPEELLAQFDRHVERRGVAKNRSEAIRDLVRDALVEETCRVPGSQVMGSLTIVYDHHASDLQETLHNIQHHYIDTVVVSTHIHVNERLCLEVIVLRGEASVVQKVADMITGTKGVRNGKLTLTAASALL